MRRAIIDIGSNTICVEVFDIESKENYKEIFSKKIYSNLIGYREDNVLSQKGCEELLYALASIYDICKLISCDNVDCFATSSLRNIDNLEQIQNMLKEHLGIVPDILSEADEAFYDYCCMCDVAGVPKRGLGLDLGGGSCQIFSFDHKLEDFISIPIGSRKLYTKFMDRSKIIPSRHTAGEIKKYVKKQLAQQGKFKKGNYDTIYAIGGAVRAILQLYSVVFSNKKVKSKSYITIDQLSDLLEKLYLLENKAIGIMCHVVPERVPTVIPALIALKTICRYTGAKKIQVVASNIRKGYLKAEYLY